MQAILLQGGALVVFLGLGLLWPRAGVPVLGRASLINLLTGGLLFGLKFLTLRGLGAVVGWDAGVGGNPPVWTGWLALGWLSSPLLQFLFVFLLSDLMRYGLHRAHHEIGFLWQFHRVHHSSVTLNATAGLRMHVVDFVQLSLLPVLLFGVLFDTRTLDPRVFVWLSVVVVTMDGFQHADLRFPLQHPLARAWGRVFNNPFFHAWHHTAEPGKHHGNYGQALVLWDRLLGTVIEADEVPAVLGLDETQALQEDVLGLQRLTPLLGQGGAAGGGG